MESLDLDKLEKRYRTQLMNSLSGYKGVQLIGTKGEEDNLAIFNSIHHLGANPPLMGFIQRPHSVERQTYENILKGKRYTFSNIREDYQDRAHQTSARYEKDVSEFEACDLKKAQTESGLPYVADATIVIELEYRNSYLIKENDTILVVGEVVDVKLDPSLLLADGTIDLVAAGSVAGIGLNGYAKPDKLQQYSYAKPDQKLKKL